MPVPQPSPSVQLETTQAMLAGLACDVANKDAYIKQLAAVILEHDEKDAEAAARIEQLGAAVTQLQHQLEEKPKTKKT